MKSSKQEDIKKRVLKPYLRGRELRNILMNRYGGKCFWCDIPVVVYEDIFNNPEGKGLPHDSATIDHLHDFERGNKKPDPEGKYKVLACYKCNFERSQRINKKINATVRSLINQVLNNAFKEWKRQASMGRKSVEELIDTMGVPPYNDKSVQVAYKEGYNQAIKELNKKLQELGKVYGTTKRD